MDEKDSMTPDTIPQSTPVDGTVPAGRKNRRPVVIGVAAVARPSRWSRVACADTGRTRTIGCRWRARRASRPSRTWVRR